MKTQAKVVKEGHPWFGLTVVIVGHAPEFSGPQLECELLSEQHLHRDQRMICAIHPNDLSLSDAMIEEFCRLDPLVAEGYRLEKARIGNRAL